MDGAVELELMKKKHLDGADWMSLYTIRSRG